MKHSVYFSIGIFLILCKQSHGNFSSTTTTFAQLPAYHEDVKEPTTTISVPPTSTNEIAYTNLSQISTSTARSITRLLRINQTETASNEEATNDTTTPTDFNICSYSDEKNYLTETLTGDIIVTIISHQSEYATATIKFIVNRINEINLLAYNKTIGVRIVKVINSDTVLDILENELDFMEHCVENPFGIFLSSVYWRNVSQNGKNYELKLWPLPDINEIKMSKIASVLNELPLPMEMKNASVELRADSMNRTKDFQNALKKENMCFNSFPSNANIFIYIGDAEFLSSRNFLTDQKLIIVPLSSFKKLNLKDIPVGAFLASESEIDINNDETISPSEFGSIASTFISISTSINVALRKNAHQTSTKFNASSKCEICNDLDYVEDISIGDYKKMLNILKYDNFESQMNYDLYRKIKSNSNQLNRSTEMEKIATTNFITNITTVYVGDQYEKISLGLLFKCENHTSVSSSSSHSYNDSHIDAYIPNEVYPPKTIIDDEIDLRNDEANMLWELRSEIWVSIGLLMSTLGILSCIAILTFIIIRICMDDVLEGNPIGSVVMLISLIAQFVSFFPFTIEYVSSDMDESNDVLNSMCIIKIFLVSVSYCLTFSLLLSRAIMLASIGSEGGFLSHVNGYIQSIICFFSFFSFLGLSTQLLIMMHTNSQHITCINVYNGHWFWAILSYDGVLLFMLVLSSPFIFKSQRNYREGVLIVITSSLCLVCWLIWIPLSLIDDNFREIMISLGVQATAWIILASLMIPRCFLIVKSIARSDFTQALPSLTSLAFAQAHQFISEPSIYECVNTTMRARSSEDETDHTHLPNEYQSPSEVPTLPLRSGRRNFIEHYNLNFNEFNEIVNPNISSPNKITRF